MPSVRTELRPTLLLAGPIVAGQVGQMLMGLTDAMMIGHVGTIPLAASAFASAVANFVMIPGLGLLSPLSVRVAQAHAEGRRSEAGEDLRHGLVLALGAGLVSALLLISLLPLLHLLGQPEAVRLAAAPYLVTIALSMVPVLLFHGMKQYCEGLHAPQAPMWIMLGGVLLNVVLNWLLIFGKLGLPALGLTGAGIATLLARCATVVALWIHLRRSAVCREDLPARWLGPLEPARLWSQLKLGVPVAAQYGFEVGAFSVAGLLMGRLGDVPLAAHQIALTCAAFTFMFPLGLSFAAGVRVGAAYGAREFERLLPIARASLLLGATVMGLAALAFLTGGELIADWFIRADDPLAAAVIPVAAQLLAIAGLFQLFDGTQVVAIGALRGLNDVRAPTVITFIAYWVLAIPAAWVLAFPAGLGARGVWLGLALGLGSAAVLLALRFERRASKLMTTGSTQSRQ